MKGAVDGICILRAISIQSCQFTKTHIYWYFYFIKYVLHQIFESLSASIDQIPDSVPRSTIT